MRSSPEWGACRSPADNELLLASGVVGGSIEPGPAPWSPVMRWCFADDMLFEVVSSSSSSSDPEYGNESIPIEHKSIGYRKSSSTESIVGEQRCSWAIRQTAYIYAHALKLQTYYTYIYTHCAYHIKHTYARVYAYPHTEVIRGYPAAARENDSTKHYVERRKKENKKRRVFLVRKTRVGARSVKK